MIPFCLTNGKNYRVMLFRALAILSLCRAMTSFFPSLDILLVADTWPICLVIISPLAFGQKWSAPHQHRSCLLMTLTQVELASPRSHMPSPRQDVMCCTVPPRENGDRTEVADHLKGMSPAVYMFGGSDESSGFNDMHRLALGDMSFASLNLPGMTPPRPAQHRCFMFHWGDSLSAAPCVLPRTIFTPSLSPSLSPLFSLTGTFLIRTTRSSCRAS